MMRRFRMNREKWEIQNAFSSYRMTSLWGSLLSVPEGLGKLMIRTGTFPKSFLSVVRFITSPTLGVEFLLG